jgi:hypothetical protein
MHDLELDFGYVVDTSLCRFCAKNFRKLLKKSSITNYLVLMTNLTT